MIAIWNRYFCSMLRSLKYFLRMLVLSAIITGCQSRSEADALYDNVMKVHDEVMPKLDDIYTRREQLKKEIANSPDMVIEKRKELEARIARLEAAAEGMMRWMREFNPPADSLGEDAMLQYLNKEMERVKQVRDSINFSLQAR